MAKTIQEPVADQTVHEAIKPQKLKDLIAKVANASKTASDANQRKGELIQTAVDNDKLHKTAFAWLMKLRKMDPVAREELRFHFEVYCEREWGKNQDLLRTTGEQPEETSEADEDLRPRHLRQPGASAAAPTSSASARVRELADKAEANLSQVGRGPNPRAH
jgi:hypothetical protein